MIKFNFNLRDPKSKKATAIHLVIRCTNWNGKRISYPTGESILPEFWESDKTKSNVQRAKSTKSFPEHMEFNHRLDKIEIKVKDTYRKYLNDNDGEIPTKDEFKKLLDIAFKRKEDVKMNFHTFFQAFIENYRLTKSKKTVQWYENTYSKILEFSKVKKYNVEFDTIDLNFYEKFYDFLTIDCNYMPNTIGKHIQNLKAVLNHSVDMGYNSNLKFQSKKFKKTSEKTNHIYLTREEVDLIYKLDLKNSPRLDRVRDLFIVACWTGLRYSDFSKIKKENISNGYISIQMEKTEDPVIIYCHQVVVEIMGKYKSNINSLPSSISGDKMRKYLKEIGSMVPELHNKITIKKTKGGQQIIEEKEKYKFIGTHTARRSFATISYLEGLDSLTIRKLTGHKSEKSFFRYIKTAPKQHADKLKEHWEKINNLKAV